MRIGPVEIRPNLVLAPMEGVTDLTFRRLIRSVGGCGLKIRSYRPLNIPFYIIFKVELPSPKTGPTQLTQTTRLTLIT